MKMNEGGYNRSYANYTRNNALNGVKSTIFGEKRVVLHSHAFSDAVDFWVRAPACTPVLNKAVHIICVRL